MKYTKPEVAVLPSAIAVIRSSQVKGQFLVVDNPILQSRATQAAYEADE